ncbi:MAG: glycosyltransferase [Actinomycetota bacterium]|nr:glycosyltransferase [Actinomycetota bacterium]
MSVVVCSLDGAATLGACLEALERQTIRDKVQVVVVDDGSTDGTAAVARQFGVELVVHERNRGISAARNSGIRVARAPVVAFTDDDCIPDRDWLECLLRPYEDDGVVAVGGAIEVLRTTGLVDRYLAANNPLAPLELELARHTGLGARFLLYVRRMWGSRAPAGARSVYSFPGASMSFRRGLLEQIGGFDERMTFGADDEYICRRVRETSPGHSLWFTPDAVVHHDFAGTLRDLWRRDFAYGKGHARTFLIDPDRRWPMVFPAPFAVLLLAVLLGRRGPVRALGALGAVPVLLPQGIRGAMQARRVSHLAFSFLRLVEETALDAGMAAGLATQWRAVAGHRTQARRAR